MGQSLDTAPRFEPLEAFYQARGQRMPATDLVDPATVPAPYHELLVHDRDMTPTLERYWGQTIHLRLLDVREANEALRREVLLVGDDSGEVAEFGAIRIDLRRLPPESWGPIRRGYRPLGTILREHAIDHASRPRGFFRVRSDDVINDALGLTRSYPLWGRCNVIYNNLEQPIAEVVEILPPIGADAKETR